MYTGLDFILMHWKQTFTVQEFISELKVFMASVLYDLKLRDFDKFTTWFMLTYVTFLGCKKTPRLGWMLSVVLISLVLIINNMFIHLIPSNQAVIKCN